MENLAALQGRVALGRGRASPWSKFTGRIHKVMVEVK